MSKAQQRKGRRAELQLVKLLRDSGYANAAPGPPLSFGNVPDVTGIDHVHVEVKSVEHLNLPAALRQAAEDASYFADGTPAVFHKHRGAGWVVSMTLMDWLSMYDSAISGGFGK